VTIDRANNSFCHLSRKQNSPSLAFDRMRFFKGFFLRRATVTAVPPPVYFLPNPVDAAISGPFSLISFVASDFSVLLSVVP